MTCEKDAFLLIPGKKLLLMIEWPLRSLPSTRTVALRSTTSIRLRNFPTANMRAPLPTVDNLLSRLVKNDQAKEDEYRRSARVLVHNRVIPLLEEFLRIKNAHGTLVEKEVYSRIGGWEALVKRLMSQRPWCFYGPNDATRLRSGERLGGAHDLWIRVGKESEGKLSMRDYLTYDEMALSALLGASTCTPFINDGDRFNCGKAAAPASHEPSGVVVGLVGARYERNGMMEHFYTVGDGSETHHHDQRVVDLFRRSFGFDSANKQGGRVQEAAFKARIGLAVELLLYEAAQRAGTVHKRAYVHVVGLGLGVWARPGEKATQTQWFVESATRALHELTEAMAASIAVVDFSYFGSISPALQEEIVAAGQTKKIDVRFSKRNPSAPLNDPDMLLVASFAWDGNSYVGNEFWDGSLDGSGDPAAACSSCIGELLDPERNPDYLDRLEVLGVN